MKALKGLLIYIGIVLAILLGLCFIVFAIMYFAPNVRVFGMSCVHYQKTTEPETIQLSDYSGYSDIEINLSSNKIGLKIVPDEEITDVKYSTKLNIFGLAFDITQYRVITNVEVKSNKLIIGLNMTEPNGLISYSDSCVEVKVPANKKIDVTVRTTSGKVTLGTDKVKLKVNNITIDTVSGNLILIGMADESGVLSINSLNMSTQSGKFDLSSITTLNVSSTIQMIAGDGYFKFKNVNAPIDVRGSDVRFDAEDINCGMSGLKFISDNGYINLKTLQSNAAAENTIVTDNCSVNIQNIYGKTGIVTTYGGINIGTTNHYTVLKSVHGNIKVEHALSDISVTTKFGGITVNEYKSNGIFISEKGDIKVIDKGDYVDGYYTKINNITGSVDADININKLLLQTTGRSKVSVTFREVKTGLTPETTFQHQVKIGEGGSCTVYLNPIISKPFKFIASGEISGEISGITLEYEGYNVQSREGYQYYPSVNEKYRADTESAYFLFLGKIHFTSYLPS